MPLSREDVLRRAEKLMRFTKGSATAAELENAAEKLGALLRENNLSMQEVEAEAMKGQILEDGFAVKFRRPPGWFIQLATVIGYATSTQWMRTRKWTEGEGHTCRLLFIGAPADAQVASYFFQVCARMLPQIARRERPIDRNGFMYGMAIGVGRRLLKMIRPPEMTQGERGLIVVKEHAIQAYIKEKHANATTIRMKGPEVRDPNSYHRGVAAAEEIPLHHGVAHASSTVPRLTATA